MTTETPYLEVEDLRNNRLEEKKVYSYEEVKLIIKEWDEQTKSKLNELEDLYSEIIRKLQKRVKELKEKPKHET